MGAGTGTNPYDYGQYTDDITGYGQWFSQIQKNWGDKDASGNWIVRPEKAYSYWTDTSNVLKAMSNSQDSISRKYGTSFAKSLRFEEGGNYNDWLDAWASQFGNDWRTAAEKYTSYAGNSGYTLAGDLPTNPGDERGRDVPDRGTPPATGPDNGRDVPDRPPITDPITKQLTDLYTAFKTNAATDFSDLYREKNFSADRLGQLDTLYKDWITDVNTSMNRAWGNATSLDPAAINTWLESQFDAFQKSSAVQRLLLAERNDDDRGIPGAGGITPPTGPDTGRDIPPRGDDPGGGDGRRPPVPGDGFFPGGYYWTKYLTGEQIQYLQGLADLRGWTEKSPEFQQEFYKLKSGETTRALNPGDYTSDTTSDYYKNLQTQANEGYGDKWTRTAYESAIAPYAQQYGDWIQNLRMQQSKTGMQSGFAKGAAQNAKYQLASQGVSALSGIRNQQNDYKYQAQAQLADITNSDRAIRQSVDQWNKNLQMNTDQFKLYYQQAERMKELYEEQKDAASRSEWLQLLQAAPYLIMAL